MSTAWEGLAAIEAIGASAAVQGAAGATTAPTAAPGFAQWVGREIETLNTQLLQAEKGVQQLAAGEAMNVHDVMLQLEQARLAMQLASQVRSRVMEAYQEVMRMQV